MSVKILIVEDDAALRTMYEFKLQAESFSVQTAADGQAGLEAARSFMPDLILLDLNMPIMDGTTMLTRLRQTKWGAHMRVIILTNISRSEAPSALRFLSVDRYIVKAHHTPAQVVDMVRDVLGL